MASSNRSGNRGGNRGRGPRSNNPEGRNQYSGVMSSARDNPLAAAAAIGGAVAAGVFLWSRRNQISDQIGNLSDQFSEWREGMGAESQIATEESSSSGGSFMANSNPPRGGRKSQAGISEEALTLKETGKTA